VTGLSQSLTLGVDYKDIENTLQSSAGSIVSPIKYLPWSIAWDGSWLRPYSFSTLRVEETFNFAGTLAGGGTKDFQANRGGVKNTSLVTGDFVALKVGLRSLLRASAVLDTIAAGHPLDLPSPDRSLLDDWTVALNITGEWSNEPLVSTEQLPLGGSSSVRGYLEGERFGDHGFDLQLELRTARWSDFAGGRLGESLQGVIFYDYGEYWLLNTERGKGPYSESGRLQGIGAGLRARLEPHGWVGPFTAEAFFAYPTVKTVSEPSSVRLHFRVRADF
jgi:hypothetical protein